MTLREEVLKNSGILVGSPIMKKKALNESPMIIKQEIAPTISFTRKKQ